MLLEKNMVKICAVEERKCFSYLKNISWKWFTLEFDTESVDFTKFFKENRKKPVSQVCPIFFHLLFFAWNWFHGKNCICNKRYENAMDEIFQFSNFLRKNTSENFIWLPFQRKVDEKLCQWKKIESRSVQIQPK